MNTFDIIDGVRRAKAAHLLGSSSIWAVIVDTEVEQRVLLDDLRSPRRSINAIGRTNRARWDSVLSAMATEPDLLPPIIIRPGDHGVLIREVAVEF